MRKDLDKTVFVPGVKKLPVWLHFVDLKRCMGCGICDNKRPVRALPAVCAIADGESQSLRNQILLLKHHRHHGCYMRFALSFSSGGVCGGLQLPSRFGHRYAHRSSLHEPGIHVHISARHRH